MSPSMSTLSPPKNKTKAKQTHTCTLPHRFKVFIRSNWRDTHLVVRGLTAVVLYIYIYNVILINTEEKKTAEGLQSLSEEVHDERVCSASHRTDNAEILLHAARTTQWPCCPPHLQHIHTVNVHTQKPHDNED